MTGDEPDADELPLESTTKEEWDFDRFMLEAMKVRSLWAILPSHQRTFEYLAELVSDFPPRQQTAALALLQAGYDAQAVEIHKQTLEYFQKEAQMNTERIKAEREWKREGRAFWVGVCLLILALACSLFLPPARVAVANLPLRIMTAVGVGMMIAFLPGLFSLDSEINIKRNKNIIKATGGFAAIVLIYLFDPGWLSSVLSWHKH
jgi:hypothetical protein